jgi:hypothetical protein
LNRLVASRARAKGSRRRAHAQATLDELTNLILEQARVLYAFWPEVFADPLGASV